MPVRKGKLKPENQQKIQKNYSTLLDEIDGKYLAAKLFQSNVLTSDDKEEIMAATTRRRRAEILVDKILDSGPGEAYNEFLKSLDEEYEHIVKQLNETDVSNNTSSSNVAGSFILSLPDEIKGRVITDADASRFAGCFASDSNWKVVPMRLDLSKSTVDTEIHGRFTKNNSEAATNLLIRWKQKMVKLATVGALLDVFYEVDKEGECAIDWPKVENVVDKIKSQMNISS